VSSPSYWFAGTRLVFERPQLRIGRLAVATDDDGLRRFLAKLNATVSYQPGQSYIVVTRGDHRTVTFTLGDPHVNVAGAMQTAAFAPYAAGDSAYLPFADLARALDVSAIDDDGAGTILQPQIASLEVRPAGATTFVVLRGASTLHFKRVPGPDDSRLTLAFSGTSSTLEHVRQIGGAALESLSIDAGGTPRNPTTVVEFDLAPGAVHALAPSDSPNSIVLAFAPAGVALGGTEIPATGDATVATAPLAAGRDSQPLQAAPAAPSAVPLESPAAAAPAPAGGVSTPTALGLAPATVTDVHLEPVDAGLNVTLGITGSVTYEWHRLADNRWYVDLKPATLALDEQDVPVQNAAVQSLRIKGFVGPNDRLPTVRVALTLATPRIVTLSAVDGGLEIAVDRLDDLDPQKSGLGELDGGKLVASVVPLPPPPPPADDGAGVATPPPADWKFAPPPPAGTNPRLIVIDPGHGGSDTGAMHNGLVEKDLTLDISRRLRALLISRGWLVKMTRDSDVDVYQPNDSARDELQARCDIANGAGARLFISVHVNSFTSGGLNGTTTYYYKADSYALADAVHARLAASLPTQDDGIRKENFYVIHHTSAPSILVETAFLSNPSDARLLKSGAFLQKVAAGVANGVGDYANPGSDGN
jgi:N-acetylmuramoyl-L-alanine amidase